MLDLAEALWPSAASPSVMAAGRNACPSLQNIAAPSKPAYFSGGMTKATEPRKRHAGAPRSRANDPDRTRADILKVATAHFAREGLSGSRVDEIAEETHTSKRMLYYYFGNKEGLYRAVLER